MNLNGWIQQWMPRIAARLPVRYRQGKMPYVFFFAVMVIVVLLTYAVISPYQYAFATFSLFATFLLVLMVLVNQGFQRLELG